MITRQDIIDEARKWIGSAYGHQGRTRRAMDCGGLMLVIGHALNITSFEELGYASFPTNGRFDEILTQELIKLPFYSTYPHSFTGDELLPADLVSFDYNNGEGTRHVGLITKWDGTSYWILEATKNHGVTEHSFRFPFTKAALQGWRVKDIV